MSNMNNNGFGHERYYRPYGVDQGSGVRLVQYKAWRIDIPHVFGYGMTLEDAIEDLTKNVAPFSAVRRSAFVNIIRPTQTKLTPLKYCIRTKHSPDMPLRSPRKNCAFRRDDECTWHPATVRYCSENSIDTTYTVRFRCVLAEE